MLICDNIFIRRRRLPVSQSGGRVIDVIGLAINDQKIAFLDVAQEESADRTVSTIHRGTPKSSLTDVWFGLSWLQRVNFFFAPSKRSVTATK